MAADVHLFFRHFRIQLIVSLFMINSRQLNSSRTSMAHPTLEAVLCKTVVLCAVFLPAAVAFGFRDEQLMALLIMLGSPTTPSGYVMAKNMGYDGVLSASATAATTLLSAFTLPGWIFVLRSAGYLA